MNDKTSIGRVFRDNISHHINGRSIRNGNRIDIFYSHTLASRFFVVHWPLDNKIHNKEFKLIQMACTRCMHKLLKTIMENASKRTMTKQKKTSRIINFHKFNILLHVKVFFRRCVFNEKPQMQNVFVCGSNKKSNIYPR